MERSTTRQLLSLAAYLLLWTGAFAKEIPVSPGKDTLVKALKGAGKGDVVVLKDGTYSGSFSITSGVTIQGAPSMKSIITGSLETAISLAGEEVVIRNLVVIGNKKTRIGLKAGLHSLRIEGCRFENLSKGIIFEGSPLCDVVCSSFIDCETGIECSRKTAPTVWGCLFMRGKLGIACDASAPYIRNSLFCAQATCVRAVNLEEGPRIRHSVFVRSSGPAIDLSGRIMNLAVRNNILHECARTAADSKGAEGFSHNILSPGKTRAGAARDDTIVAGQRANIVEKLSITVQKDGAITVAESPAMAKGIGEPWQPKGTAGRIGFDAPAFKPGKLEHLKAAPPPRWTEPYVANSVNEEYQCLAMWGLTSRGQRLISKEEKHMDVLVTNRAEKEPEITFDVSRFYGDNFR
ncbi:MAG TPA: right-handed parallel beta-helix repeat-containing protein [Planctomycetota bacterium]|jgi:hypothetical protein|nr:hypothetical protein [Planctomycetota bacterium]OQC21933.1 MAG: hypothetical protein BWX69_00580 [Planctomycetes bacterium ADurb.Bin069]NMD34247.1 hypothetical protein [Planctomycetota bacterium]HNS00033.1 right-handed parallel beta-helix repeat-containing protein [Planctomycetota bacterium]HNU27055.1 right-handed parallel beta-helix repeat-containing protein [Planctomycetota bacterium]